MEKSVNRAIFGNVVLVLIRLKLFEVALDWTWRFYPFALIDIKEESIGIRLKSVFKSVIFLTIVSSHN